MRRPSVSSSPAVLPHETPRDTLTLASDSSLSSAPILPEVATEVGQEDPLGLDSLPPDSLGRPAALPDSLPATILPDKSGRTGFSLHSSRGARKTYCARECDRIRRRGFYCDVGAKSSLLLWQGQSGLSVDEHTVQLHAYQYG